MTFSIWDLESANINKIEIAWKKCSKYVLGVPAKKMKLSFGKFNEISRHFKFNS